MSYLQQSRRAQCSKFDACPGRPRAVASRSGLSTSGLVHRSTWEPRWSNWIIWLALKLGGRFFCLTPHADYVWYRTMAPLLGYATKHLSSDRIPTRDEFSTLLDQAGFRSICSAPWTFIPKGDMPTLLASLLTVLDAIGRHARLDPLRGGLSLCACKNAEPA
jgi:hypothetical protein